MTLRIDKATDGQRTTIRLSGQIQWEHLEELKSQVYGGLVTVLDLDEVTLVDLDVVRFLNACKADGVELVHCARYIREWMLREQE